MEEFPVDADDVPFLRDAADLGDRINRLRQADAVEDLLGLYNQRPTLMDRARAAQNLMRRVVLNVGGAYVGSAVKGLVGSATGIVTNAPKRWQKKAIKRLENEFDKKLIGVIGGPKISKWMYPGSGGRPMRRRYKRRKNWSMSPRRWKDLKIKLWRARRRWFTKPPTSRWMLKGPRKSIGRSSGWRGYRKVDYWSRVSE